MITDMIKNNEINKKLISDWYNSIDVILHNSDIKTINIPGNIGDKYKGDLYGLFLELGIAPEYIYPHILANGYVNSQDYNGKKLDMVILDNMVLKNYLNYFKSE